MSIQPLPQPSEEFDPVWARQLVQLLEIELMKLKQPIQTGYSPSNVTTTRTFDADATTLAEVADVVGTLIEDMQARGMLG